MKIEPIEKNLPHEVSELICLKCHRRWIGAYPEKTWLKDLHCKCGAVGCVIKTGQTLPESCVVDAMIDLFIRTINKV